MNTARLFLPVLFLIMLSIVPVHSGPAMEDGGGGGGFRAGGGDPETTTGVVDSAADLQREKIDIKNRQRSTSTTTSTSKVVDSVSDLQKEKIMIKKMQKDSSTWTTTTIDTATGSQGTPDGSEGSSPTTAEDLNGSSILGDNSEELDTVGGGKAEGVTGGITLNIAERNSNRFILIGNEDEDDHDADPDKAWAIEGVPSWFTEKSDIGGNDDSIAAGLAKDNVPGDSSGKSLLLVLGDGEGRRGGVDAKESAELKSIFPKSEMARLFGKGWPEGQGKTMDTFEKWFAMVNRKFYCILGINDNNPGPYARCAGNVIDEHPDFLVKCAITGDPNAPTAVEGEDLIKPENISIVPDCIGNTDECYEKQVPMVQIKGIDVKIPFGADVIVLGGGPGCYATSVRDEEEKVLYPFFRKVFHVSSHNGNREYTAKALEAFLEGKRDSFQISGMGNVEAEAPINSGSAQDEGASEVSAAGSSDPAPVATKSSSSGKNGINGPGIPKVLLDGLAAAKKTKWFTSHKCLQFAGTLAAKAGAPAGKADSSQPQEAYPANKSLRGYQINQLPKAVEAGTLKPGMLIHVKIHYDKDPAYHVENDAHHWFVYMGKNPNGVPMFADNTHDGNLQTADEVYANMKGWQNSEDYGDEKYGYVPRVTAVHDPFASQR